MSQFDSLLGKNVQYNSKYSGNNLQVVPRALGREALKKQYNLESINLHGWDIWNCYELSWLNIKGKPEVRLLELCVPAHTECIVESKSLKLYLHTLNNTRFDNQAAVQELISKDLSDTLQSPVHIKLYTLPEALNKQKLACFTGENIDDLDIEISEAEYQHPESSVHLAADAEIVSETLYTNLLKSKCLVTSQPDWAALQITYHGKQIDRASLLKYIVLLRNNNEFHEDCVERIYTHLMQNCQPKELTVQAKYTRRGGIDINPYRTSKPQDWQLIDTTRDIRQ